MKKNKRISTLRSLLFLLLILLIIRPVLSLDSAYGPEIVRDQYSVSRSKVDRILNQGDVFTDILEITNLKTSDLKATFSITEGIQEVVDLGSSGIIIPPGNSTKFSFLVKGIRIMNYSGILEIGGDISEELLVNISVVEGFSHAPLLLNVEFLKDRFPLGGEVGVEIKVNKLKLVEITNASFKYNLLDQNNNTYFLGSETKDILNSFSLLKSFELPDGLEEGNHVLEIIIEYDNHVIVNRSNVLLKRSFLQTLLFGVLPVWSFLVLFGVILIGGGLFYLFKRGVKKRKKYQMNLDTRSIPSKKEEFFLLGKVAEINLPAYLDPDKLTTHCIVAGATGGGKSISAQVLVEEALMKNIAVIVFDPTAQWSGMLRKCTDKNMFSYYPKFGLKESDARAFKGNVRQVKNAREVIELKKYISPGQIHIFTLNKLNPNDMDTFVASIIRQIFVANLEESPNLKILLVFDEVHRLLSKFGGSGEGFLQVERACREVRKWGMGVMLISQVLSDFVGEIKANISTEVQMRTRDEGDLNRINTKYGESFLQSLVKASAGVGMFVNSSYNHGRPYFVNFRPILHNTRRLSDEELDKYNKYNDTVDDLEYQIEQLEKEKIDTFDLKMELKLVKDKIMTGNFSVVEIYLEGLVPRIRREWEELGKKPKKREIQLVEEKEIQKSIEEAKKAREKFEKEEAKKEKTEEVSSNKEEAKKEKTEEVSSNKEEAKKEKTEDANLDKENDGKEKTEEKSKEITDKKEISEKSKEIDKGQNLK